MKFIKGVIGEIKATSWPSFAQTRKDTSTVIGTSILFAAYFALADWVILTILKAFVM